MCILVYSIIIAEQQRVGLLKCCANVVLSLSPSETDDENTRAMLPRCSAGFIIDVEPFSSQFNSAEHSSILCYLLYAFYLCKKLTCTNFIAQLGVKDLHSIDWPFFSIFSLTQTNR